MAPSASRRLPPSERQALRYLAEPAVSTGAPVVIIHSWWGLTPSFERLADQLAADGHLVGCVDLFRARPPRPRTMRVDSALHDDASPSTGRCGAVSTRSSSTHDPAEPIRRGRHGDVMVTTKI